MRALRLLAQPARERCADRVGRQRCGCGSSRGSATRCHQPEAEPGECGERDARDDPDADPHTRCDQQPRDTDERQAETRPPADRALNAAAESAIERRGADQAQVGECLDVEVLHPPRMLR